MDTPTSTYVIVEGPSATSVDAGRILAYANNEYSEGAYVLADLTGQVLRVFTY